MATQPPGPGDNLGLFVSLSTIGAFLVGSASAIGALIAAAVQTQRRERRLLAIVNLRRQGVVLRNHAMTGISSAAQFAALRIEFDKWHESAADAVSKLSAQEGENFKTLDKWSDDDARGVSAEAYASESSEATLDRSQIIFMLSAWLRVLNEIRERYSR